MTNPAACERSWRRARSLYARWLRQFHGDRKLASSISWQCLPSALSTFNVYAMVGLVSWDVTAVASGEVSITERHVRIPSRQA